MKEMASFITISCMASNAPRRVVGQWGGTGGAVCEDHFALAGSVRVAAAISVRKLGASVIDTLAIPKIRRDSVKRMTQTQNTSYSFAETNYFRVASREHTLAPPGRHRPRHSQMSLTACQNTPAIDGAFYRPNGTLYQLQPSFHTQSTEPEPTARARRAGEEFYETTLAFMFVSFRLLGVESI